MICCVNTSLWRLHIVGTFCSLRKVLRGIFYTGGTPSATYFLLAFKIVSNRGKRLNRVMARRPKALDSIRSRTLSAFLKLLGYYYSVIIQWSKLTFLPVENESWRINTHVCIVSGRCIYSFALLIFHTLTVGFYVPVEGPLALTGTLVLFSEAIVIVSPRLWNIGLTLDSKEDFVEGRNNLFRIDPMWKNCENVLRMVCTV